MYVEIPICRCTGMQIHGHMDIQMCRSTDTCIVVYTGIQIYLHMYMYRYLSMHTDIHRHVGRTSICAYIDTGIDTRYWYMSGDRDAEIDGDVRLP